MEAHSRLTEVRVENFMSIEKADITFDDRNIITIKGYNDSGKSALLKAVRVLLEDWRKTKQKYFIKDEKQYFRITGIFDDGVKLVRMKYRNGQSLYEMTKDGQEIYTNKSGRTLLTVREMPPIIRKYLDMSIYNGRAIYAQSCNESYALVETTGTENYKMLGEASDDGTLLRSVLAVKEKTKENNAHVQEVGIRLDQAEYTINNLKTDDEVIETLKGLDKTSDRTNESARLLKGILSMIEELTNLHVSPYIPDIEHPERMSELAKIEGYIAELSKARVPYIENIHEINRRDEIDSIKSILNRVLNWQATPYIEEVDYRLAQDLAEICDLATKCKHEEEQIAKLERSKKIMESQAETLERDCLNEGLRMTKCPNCGFMYPVYKVGE